MKTGYTFIINIGIERMKAINILLETLIGKCRFRNEYTGYAKQNITCNKDAGGYCGMYRNFLTFK